MRSLRALSPVVLFAALSCGESPAPDAGALLRDARAAVTVREHHHGGHQRPDRRLQFLGRFYDQFSHERAFVLAAMLPDEMTWNVTGWRADVVPFAGSCVGRRMIWEHFRDYFGAIRVARYQFEYKLADAEHVTWHFRLVADVPSTGKTFDV